ncbi:glycosyltransferase family 1 protein [Thalassobius vesicularis]|uniref:Glycosyltransferase family 1 protein n=1 Tax=Thalassobius vesicularis TaxID=1294297 RepID=A0A4S3MD18_9RHOB|nr:glycosyltransferase family 4 protein [Thalassobius vesicularis]THD76759.1 glycosyltransferase family 1 protein [Thalassobius vesicularis]
MRALHVIDTLGRGGAEQVLTTLLPELARQGCPADVAVLRAPYDLQDELQAAGISVYRLGACHKWNLPRRAVQIAKLARSLGADVVHAHLYFPAVSVALMRRLGLSRAKCFVTFHNLAYAGANRAGLGLSAKKALASWLYPRGFETMFGCSRAVADHYQYALNLSRVEVLNNPIDLSKLPIGRGSGQAVPRIVVPGRLVSEKGHDVLNQALTKLKTPVDVVFAGGGPLQDRLARDNPAVRITGTLDHAELLDQVAQADLVVVPSRYEGFGLATLEAMALARPIVATNVGGLPEVIGDSGLLVPSEDPAVLANAIETLLSDSDLRASLGSQAQARAQQFSAPVIAARLLGYYHGHPKEGQL